MFALVINKFDSQKQKHSQSMDVPGPGAIKIAGNLLNLTIFSISRTAKTATTTATTVPKTAKSGQKWPKRLAAASSRFDCFMAK